MGGGRVHRGGRADRPAPAVRADTSTADTAKIDSSLSSAVAKGKDATFFVVLKDQADLSGRGKRTHAAKAKAAYNELRAQAEEQPEVADLLPRQGEGRPRGLLDRQRRPGHRRPGPGRPAREALRRRRASSRSRLQARRDGDRRDTGAATGRRPRHPRVGRQGHQGRPGVVAVRRPRRGHRHRQRRLRRAVRPPGPGGQLPRQQRRRHLHARLQLLRPDRHSAPRRHAVRQQRPRHPHHGHDGRQGRHRRRTGREVDRRQGLREPATARTPRCSRPASGSSPRPTTTGRTRAPTSPRTSSTTPGAAATPPSTRTSSRPGTPPGIFEAFAAGNDGDGATCSTTDAPGAQAPAYGVGAYDVERHDRRLLRLRPLPRRRLDEAEHLRARASTSAPPGRATRTGRSPVRRWRPRTSRAPSPCCGRRPPRSSATSTRPAQLLNEGARDVDDTHCGGTADVNNVLGRGQARHLRRPSTRPRTPRPPSPARSPTRPPAPRWPASPSRPPSGDPPAR